MATKTYSGKEKYIFISYSHKNSDRVLKVVDMLDKLNYRQWYDGGIKAGSNWPEIVASHLLYSDTVVFFISKTFIMSQNCQREVNYAVAENKKMICVYLEEVDLPADMKMQFSSAISFNAYDLNPTEITNKIIDNLSDDYIGDGIEGYEDKNNGSSKKNIWFIISIILIVVGLSLVVVIYGQFNNWFSKTGVSNETIVEDNQEIEINTFKDSASMNILLKTYSGDSLYICGNTMISKGDVIKYRDGNFYINENQIEKGKLKTWDKDDENMTYLTVCNEEISDFSILENCQHLKYLDISGNPISDISFLSKLTELQVLKIMDVDVTDYSIINQLSNLQYLYIDEDQLLNIKETLDISDIDVVVK